MYGTSAMPEPNNPDTLDWFGRKVIQHFIRKANYYIHRWHEVWNMQQHLMDTWTKSFGNFVQIDIYERISKLWPDGSIVLFQCTYYDNSHKEDNVIHVDILKEISGCETIVEAMHCAGDYPILHLKQLLMDLGVKLSDLQMNRKKQIRRLGSREYKSIT